MLRSIFRRHQQVVSGRWKTDKTVHHTQRTIDFANHDHCGGDQCAMPRKSERVKKRVIKPELTAAEKKEGQYMWPFLL